MISLRTEKTETEYEEKLKTLNQNDCFFCSARPVLIHDFNLWRIVENDFPYDVITKTHHMLTPKRHVAKESMLSEEERMELFKIKEEILPTLSYHMVISNLPIQQSIPGHFHLHVIELKS